MKETQSWENVPGWFEYPNFYKKMVDSFESGSIFVEVGCFMGRSTSCMAQYIKESGKQIDFYAIDHWEGSVEHKKYYSEVDLWKTFEKYMIECNLTEYIRPIKMNSVEASKLFPDMSIEFLHLDASHEYEDVLADIKAWYPKVKIGGVISGDDYTIRDFPGVVKAVSEYFSGKKVWILNKKDDCSNLWTLEKTE